MSSAYFPPAGLTQTDSSKPIVSKPSDLKYASMVLWSALGDEGLPYSGLRTSYTTSLFPASGLPGGGFMK